MSTIIGREVGLLAKYPKMLRDPGARAAARLPEDQLVARQFGKEFFDGDRRYGYGGFSYHPRFWGGVVQDFLAFYPGTRSVLDVGCAKGFMLYDFKQADARIDVRGCDISQYAIDNCKPEISKYLTVADAKSLPYGTWSFDLVISINTLHNLALDDCKQALRELERVSEKHKYIMVDAYRTGEEAKRMFDWNLTAQTICHVDRWREIFQEVGYTGDYGWFIP